MLDGTAPFFDQVPKFANLSAAERKFNSNDEIIRFHNDNDSIMKNLQGESKKPVKTTVREVKKWMKTLERLESSNE